MPLIITDDLTKCITTLHFRRRHPYHGQLVHPKLRQDRRREDGVQCADHLQTEVVGRQADVPAQAGGRHGE